MTAAMLQVVLQRDVPRGQPVLTEIEPAMIPYFRKGLLDIVTTDPFARSAAYYAMTGRHGLWLYADDATGMVIARHPNRPDKLLLFPPFGENPAELLEKAINDPAMPPGEKQLARLTKEQFYLALRLQAKGYEAPTDEDVLDWTYPVHIVCAKKLLSHEGGEFNNFRSHLNKAMRAGYTAQAIDPHKDANAILETVSFWAKEVSKPGFSFDDLTGPTRAVLELMRGGAENVRGVMVCDQGQPLGFWLWDEVDSKDGMAASLVRVSIGHRLGKKGAAEFAALKMAEMLVENGFDKICLGGSETESLDQFKRKLVPAGSVELQSVNIVKQRTAKQASRKKMAVIPSSMHDSSFVVEGISP